MRLSAALVLIGVVSGCSKGFGVNVEVDRGCLKNPVAGSVTTQVRPSGMTQTRNIDDPAGFFTRERRVVVVPPEGTTQVTVTVSARDADGTAASGSVTVAVEGNQVARASVVLGGCAAPPADLAVADGAVDASMLPEDIATTPADLVPVDLATEPMPDMAGPADLTKAPADLQLKCNVNQILVPAGTFTMGAKDLMQHGATPEHQVTLTPFCIDVAEVTVAEYKACVDAKACTLPMTGGQCNWGVNGKESHPVNCVDWGQSGAYCKWANSQLPTEAQWEYAARFDDQRNYPWGNTPPAKQLCWANMTGTCPVKTHPAGVSKLGLHDLAGNVFEWVADCFEAYPAQPQTDPTGPAQCPLGVRVARGGGYVAIDAYVVRTAFRYESVIGDRSTNLGIRCARTGK